MAYKNILFFFLAFGIGNSYGADLTLYPVQNGQIIVDKTCEVGGKLQWDKDLLLATSNLKKGDKLLALTQANSKQVIAQDLSCFKGECSANYVSIKLTDGGNDILGIIKKSEANNIHVSPIQLESADLSECTEIYLSISYAENPELPNKRKCQKVTLPDNSKLIIGTKSFIQEHEYVFDIVSAQVGLPQKGPTIQVDQDESPLQPVLSLVDDNKNVSLLWRKESGICCPSKVTLVMSKNDIKGVINFGQKFKAGGQPCGN